MNLKHPNIITYVDHFIENDYILLVTELFGNQWDPTSIHEKLPSADTAAKKCKPSTTSKKNDVKKDKTSNNPNISECSPLHRLSLEQENSIKRRTSCDLFECIDARKSSL